MMSMGRRKLLPSMSKFPQGEGKNGKNRMKIIPVETGGQGQWPQWYCIKGNVHVTIPCIYNCRS